MLFEKLHKHEIFKRAHLVSLSGMNEGTLKGYLPFLHKASGRTTAERKASRFTGIEAMTVIVMAALQQEWDIRPEKSFQAAYRYCFQYALRIGSLMDGEAGTDPSDRFKRTYSAIFPPDFSDDGVYFESPKNLATEVEGRYPNCLSFLGFSDFATGSIVFHAVLDLYDTLTGIDLILDSDPEHTRRYQEIKKNMEARRDDAQTNPRT